MGDSEFVYLDVRAFAKTSFEMFVAEGMYEGETVKRIADLANLSRHEVREVARIMLVRKQAERSFSVLHPGNRVRAKLMGRWVVGTVVRRADLHDLVVRHISDRMLGRLWYIVHTDDSGEFAFLRRTLEVVDDGTAQHSDLPGGGLPTVNGEA